MIHGWTMHDPDPDDIEGGVPARTDFGLAGGGHPRSGAGPVGAVVLVGAGETEGVGEAGRWVAGSVGLEDLDPIETGEILGAHLIGKGDDGECNRRLESVPGESRQTGAFSWRGTQRSGTT